MIVKRIGIFSLAKFFAILYGGLGLIGGLFMSAVSLIGMIFSHNYSSAYSSPSASYSGLTSYGGIVTGLGAVVCLPILYGLLGFIGGIVTAFVANIALKLSGGLELDTAEKWSGVPSTAAPPPIPGPQAQ
jgi:hypothetical protein